MYYPYPPTAPAPHGPHPQTAATPNGYPSYPYGQPVTPPTQPYPPAYPSAPAYPAAAAYPAAPGYPAAPNSSASSSLLPSNRFLKGLAIGAAAAYLLTNEQVQTSAIKGAVKAWSLLQGGLAELKERFHDAEAELQAGHSETGE